MPQHPLVVWLQETGTLQRELAEKVGTFQSHISLYLSGNRGLTPEVAEKMREVTGISLDDLLLRSPKRLKEQATRRAKKARVSA